MNGEVRILGGRLLTLLTALLLVMMLFACGTFSVGFIMAGGIIPVTMGGSLGILCLLGFWALYHEISFGFKAGKVRRGVYSQGLVPAVSMVEDPDRKCEFWIGNIESGSDTYDSWYHLAMAYDEAGDRKKARKAMREAIRCYDGQASFSSNTAGESGRRPSSGPRLGNDEPAGKEVGRGEKV